MRWCGRSGHISGHYQLPSSPPTSVHLNQLTRERLRLALRLAFEPRGLLNVGSGGRTMKAAMVASNRSISSSVRRADRGSGLSITRAFSPKSASCAVEPAGMLPNVAVERIVVSAPCSRRSLTTPAWQLVAATCSAV